MAHLGDFDVSAVLYGKFTTYRPSTGAAYTLGGTPALSVYKDNSTTQSTAGVTLTADFDTVTGLNHFAIDTGADGTFYSAGSFFDVVITTGTVDSVSVVGAVVASFTLRKSSALKPATAGRTLVVDGSGLADANVVKVGPSGSGTAQTARDIGASVLLSAGTGTGQLDFTSGVVKANLAQILGTALTETAGQIAAGFKKFFNIATPAATMDHLVLVDTVTTYTGNTPQTGDAYARLGAPANASVSADIAAVKTDTAGVKSKTDNLPASPAAVGDIPTAAAIADQVWDELIAGHAVSGSTGEALSAAGAAGDPWITALPGSYSAGQAGYIVGTNLNATVGSRATQTSVDTIDDYIDTEVAAIKAYADRTVCRGTVSGTSPTTTSFTSSALSPAGVDADQFKGRIIVFDNDTTTTALRGQATDITANTGAANPQFTFSALTTAPQSGDTFSIV